MSIYSKKEIKERLLNSFGEVKDESFDFGQIESYFRKKDHKNTFQVLSDKTCNDLDFSELFMYIDRTNSKVGQQFLYDKLRTIPLDSYEIDEDEKLIEHFSTNHEIRIATQKLLMKLNGYEAYYIPSLFQDKHLTPPQWFFIVPLLSLTSILSLILMFFIPNMLFILIGVFIANIGIHYWNKRNLFQYLGSIPQLLRLNSIAKELLKKDSLKNVNPNISKSISIIDKVRNRMSFFKVESKLQGDLDVFFWGVLELIKILFLLEPLLLFGVLKQLNTKRREIEEVFEFVGKIDSLISIASFRKGLDSYCIPVVSTDKRWIVAEDLYHPLIINCVKNSIHVQGKSILLTGSNMSGKTSFIRTIGINVITGLTLNTCFAARFTTPRTCIHSAIRISDDLMNDKSYYFEEVLTIKDMIDKSSTYKPNLFLLDEIFKGTNTIERVSAGKAVLSTLTKSENLVFVSTHDIELTNLLNEEYELYHFSEIIENNSVDFDYKLKEGKLKNRNAIRILQINGYPESIINEAIEISKEFDNITALHSNNALN